MLSRSKLTGHKALGQLCDRSHSLTMNPIIFLLPILGFLAMTQPTQAAPTALIPRGPDIFSTKCVSWLLSKSPRVGQGWAFKGFCKNDSGTWAWDNSNILDACVGTHNGHLLHQPHGNMSGQCQECNDNDGWGKKAEDPLVCNCTNSQGVMVESSLNWGKFHCFSRLPFPS